MKTKFNVSDWLPTQDEAQKPTGKSQTAPKTLGKNDALKVEKALEALEASGIDITSDYRKWRDIGFALSHAFGESGREYFHRVSRFHPDYDHAECDLQYSHCMASTGSGITLASFFYYVKEAGITGQPSMWDSPPPSRTFEEPMPPELLERTGRTEAEDAPKMGTARDSEFAGAEDVPEMGSAEDSEFGEEDASGTQVPTLPEEIFSKLPAFLQEVVQAAESKEERDILLLGALTSLSACLPNVHGIYNGDVVGANIYLFVVAPASAGKGRLNLCKRLVLPLHRDLLQQNKQLKEAYELELAAYNTGKDGDKPLRPEEKMLFIPANNSSTGIFQLLANNEGRGLIFETEGDTMSQALKTEYGNYSDGFRKAFHHESIAYFRRTEREYVEVERPALSTVLSGTPRQVARLMPSAENGLFSRFLFYYMNVRDEWADVFRDRGETRVQDQFDVLGGEFYQFLKRLEKQKSVRITPTPEQAAKFNEQFSKLQTHYLAVTGEDSLAVVRRMGLMCFRITMILSMLRLMDKEEFPDVVYCSDEVFETATSMILSLLEHSNYVYHCLPVEKSISKRTNQRQRFTESLPMAFTRKDILKIANRMKLAAKTAERWIADLIKAKIVARVSQGKYVVNVPNKPV